MGIVHKVKSELKPISSDIKRLSDPNCKEAFTVEELKSQLLETKRDLGAYITLFVTTQDQLKNEAELNYRYSEEISRLEARLAEKEWKRIPKRFWIPFSVVLLLLILSPALYSLLSSGSRKAAESARYDDGYSVGYSEAYEVGFSDGAASVETEIRAADSSDDGDDGNDYFYSFAYDEELREQYHEGYNDGYNYGFEEGVTAGYADGYKQGFIDGPTGYFDLSE